MGCPAAEAKLPKIVSDSEVSKSKKISHILHKKKIILQTEDLKLTKNGVLFLIEPFDSAHTFTTNKSGL
jgi:hypothetical protein